MVLQYSEFCHWTVFSFSWRMSLLQLLHLHHLILHYGVSVLELRQELSHSDLHLEFYFDSDRDSSLLSSSPRIVDSPLIDSFPDIVISNLPWVEVNHSDPVSAWDQLPSFWIPHCLHSKVLLQLFSWAYSSLILIEINSEPQNQVGYS